MAEQETTGNETGRSGDKRDEHFSLPQLEFEMALDMAEGHEEGWIHLVRQAAEMAGGDLLFVLPSFSPDGEAREKAMVRIMDDGREMLLFVSRGEQGFVYEGEEAIPDEIKDFARASIDVLELMQADEDITAQRGEDDTSAPEETPA
ncbi:hypothetical protein [Afifella sp. IM 167]|uniref:hypothetical protein n=1 Tax=Afifella sp. IM 167 TaxID=2033586 RepID=UPI001CCE9CD5|nr:hypothetical protein [Afifella sp. IM 167]MBZ8133302.1 hypothetical protein [Afifella sp. IM 167]